MSALDDGRGRTVRRSRVSEVSLADAKASLSVLVEQVPAGDPVDILRGGKIVARLTAASRPRKRIDSRRLKTLTSHLPRQPGAGDFVRSMRDSDRY
jgi:antitoxin (DNA-binding transcriptional repressor) of toxin-antitoxin stability system